jgi:hypothetical protein
VQPCNIFPRRCNFRRLGSRLNEGGGGGKKLPNFYAKG